MEIRRLFPGDEDEVRLANDLFDRPSDPPAVRAFLRNPANHLLVAYIDDRPAGFIRGQELQRLDTVRPMLFLYEIGVAEEYRREGIGTALVREFARLGEERGCSEMFVLTNHSNTAAMRMYASGGGQLSREHDIAMFEWDWN